MMSWNGSGDRRRFLSLESRLHRSSADLDAVNKTLPSFLLSSVLPFFITRESLSASLFVVFSSGSWISRSSPSSIKFPTTQTLLELHPIKMSSRALPQTLRSITAIKIGELSKQRALFDKQRTRILQAASKSPDLRSKAQVLLEGVTKLKGFPNDAFDKEDLDVDESDHEGDVSDGSERAAHVNVRRFLLQSRYDLSVSDRSLKEWVSELENEVRYLQLRHEHASFYSKLVTEWLASLEEEPAATAETEGEGETVGRAEMHEQRETWENYVFKEADVNKDAIHDYLDRLFTETALSKQALKELREKIKSFGTELGSKRTWITVHELEWVSKALLRSDLLSKEKTNILKEFMRNPAVAQEVADVLNMRLAALESWSWPAEGIPVEMRRQLNGKYRVFMDEDILDALLFQYLGVKWAVTFRSAFDNFVNTRAWKKQSPDIPKRVKRQHSKYFLDTGRGYLGSGIHSVEDYRLRTYKTNYFMTQLPSSVEENVPEYGDEGDAGSTYSTERTHKNALETKHSLLHLLITESLIYTSQYGGFTALRSDFKYFGPSLPHTTMLTVLEYFGMPQNWLEFFRTFLESPLKFIQDGPDAAIQVRKRGIPMSHTLSDCFGEAVLFCMDYTVNKNTDGAFLYRLHDDFWFWGHEKTCVQAWKAMSEFTQVMGLEFNEEKTGTVRLAQKDSQKQEAAPKADDLLPAGDIRWGFLKLDAQECRFVIDQEQVDKHIEELQRQISACPSIFAWVQAWNSYFGRFFANNFGKPAVCFGRSHIDMAISTLSRIERSLFPDSPSGVTDHLRKMIAQRFDIHDLPEGFFYFPVELGGLELLNPYVPLLAMREDIKKTPQGRLHKARLEDEKDYYAAKEVFDKSGGRRDSDGESESAEFMSLAEYTKYAESFSIPLLQAYRDLVRIPNEVDINQTPKLRANQMSLGEDTGVRSAISEDWMTMSPYWRWIAELYQGKWFEITVVWPP